MREGHRGRFLFSAGICAILACAPLFGWDTAASAASAEGFEGLEYNPAAVAAARSVAVGLAAGFGGSDDYTLSVLLSDSLRLDYACEAAAKTARLRYGLAFPRDSAVHFGVRASADLMDFRMSQIDLATGLLWYPHRYLALAATQEHLIEPLDRRYVFGAALRPFTDRLTLFVDLGFDGDFTTVQPALGFRSEPLDGVRIDFRADNDLRDFIVAASVAADVFRLDLSLAGDFALKSMRVGAGVRYDLRPSRSILPVGAKVLHLRLDRPIDPGSGQRESVYNLDTLVARLYQLAESPRLETLIVSFESTAVLSIDVLEELVEAFTYLKRRGKRIISYLDTTYSEFDYLAAAAGSTVVVAPYALLPLVGVGSRQLFFKDLFERLGIEVEYARSSEYKSALDRFLRDSLSEENRRQLEEFLGSSYELILDVLVTGRGFSRQRAAELVDGGPYWSENAAQLGLVDEVLYAQEFERRYLEDSFAAELSFREFRGTNWRRPRIAVVKATGTIVSGQALSPWDRLATRRYITDDNLIPVLEHLQMDSRVRAVLLYIDSGGGDGMISDKIWKAIMELKQEKPVAVVMGRLAASGGYYLAMAGDRVFARRTALTGSIGSFTYKLVIAEMLERLGVASDSIRYGENAELFSPFAGLSERQRDKLLELNRSFSDHFYRRVAESRSLPYETVERLGGGRIYSGERALELELIDQIGGVHAALQYLERELGLSPGQYDLRYYPEWNMLLRLILQELGTSGRDRAREMLPLAALSRR